MADMMAPGRKVAPRSAWRGSRVALCALAAFLAMPLVAPAQQAPVAPAGPPAASPGQAPALPAASDSAPAKKEGFFDALEKWWDKSAADFKASLDKLNERNEKATKDAAAAAKEAAEAFSKLSGTRIVEGRELCEVAPNGSPDCQAAAEKICKAKGFALGKSADIQTNRKCSARAWLSGETERACTQETIVIKAACQ